MLATQPYLLTILFTLPFLATCAHTQPPPEFNEPVDQGIVANDAINEASGLAVSSIRPGVLWTHNDSGDTTRIFAVGRSGEDLGEFYLEGATARDWEDIAVGPGPVEGQSYIFVGDIGDNGALYETKKIYRFVEPLVSRESEPKKHVVADVETITYRYPDGPRDAEALMVDPLTRDIYVVSKREDAVRIYRAAYPQSTSEIITLEHVGTLDSLTLITAGDISTDGKGILLKNYLAVYYWHREPGETIAEAMQRRPVTLPYTPEPQGEAIAWEPGGLGYWTVSEEFREIPTRLWLYPPKKTSTIEEIEGNLHNGRDLDLSLACIEEKGL